MRDDNFIKIDVGNKIEFEPGITSKNIMVNVHNGIVTLSGSVSNYYQKSLAERAAKNVQGVKGIVEELQVNLGESFKRSDEEIAEAAIRAIDWDATIPSGRVTITVEHGIITLTGDVEYQYQRERASQDVKYIYGVKNVVNNITLKPTLTINPDQVASKILSEFQRNAIIDARNIRVKTDGSKIILKGNLHSWAEYDEASHAAWSIPGVTQVDMREVTISYPNYT
ncbi:BON domain-containing protein [Candidatus Odyssella thessalonicensis]|uniref:BON domain-containing protein n=1 Tax=Candidatus Odyssella thessalonicensis TaxID=84647 RepID=UPI000225AC6C|nr:BON domain-containing protein [Candidatus Odyssella thessalonicensis]